MSFKSEQPSLSIDIQVKERIYKILEVLNIHSDSKTNTHKVYDLVVQEIQHLKEKIEQFETKHNEPGKEIESLQRTNKDQSETINSLAKKINDIDIKMYSQ